MSTQTHTFNVKGMHCKACVLVTEGELKDLGYVTGAKSSLETNTVTVSGDFDNAPAVEVAQRLTKVLLPFGYTLSLDQEQTKKSWSEFAIAIPVALGFALAFIALQKLGIVNLVSAQRVTYGTAFIIGIIASLSTCMAVVGGLVLSMSATFAKSGDTFKPQLWFHGGRLVAFFMLGGTIGALGAAFTLNTSTTFVLSVVIGLVMLILGINLLDVFSWSKKLQPTMPKFISRHALSISKSNHAFTPLLLGIATFFLPCGFTQSMQLYTLSTGSFLGGGLTMLAFALGTLPVLSLVSFSSLNIQKSGHAGIFFKSAGLVVILFAVFNLINSLVIIGLVPPIFNF